MKLSKTCRFALTAALGCLALGLASTSAAAATVSTTIGLSATIQATCTVTATPMAFGTYIPTNVSDATSTLTVTCTNTTPYNVGLDAGSASGATVTTRSMTSSGGALLSYVLTSDAAFKTNWGNSTGSWVGGSGVGSAQTLTVYGEVASGQFLAPGAYSDTVTATVNY